ncbi:MAG: hypothetical protein AB1344_03785 [Pseudomonadota bacterium]
MYRFILLLCLIPLLSWAEPIEIIQLQHRTAEEIIPLLRPVLGPDDALSGQGDQLILRGSTATQAQVRRLLEDLDHAPRNLLISVRSSAQHMRGDPTIARHIYVGPGGIRIEGEAGGRYSTGREATQQLRVMEGMPAMIHVGEETVSLEPALIPYPGGIAVAPSTVARRSGRWLSVVPRIQGQQVVLDIEPSEAHVDPRHPRTLSVQEISTRIIAPFGEWVLLGGVDSSEQSGRGLAITTQSQSRQVWVKVELTE